MENYAISLSLLALTGCLVEHSDLTSLETQKCAPQLSILEDSCESADVVGAHSNEALYGAVNAFKECVGGKIRVVCSYDDFEKILTISHAAQ